MTKLLELICAWSTSQQVLFVIVSAFLMTYLTDVVIQALTRDFMSSITILFRGWPPSHVKSDDDVDEIESDEEK